MKLANNVRLYAYWSCGSLKEVSVSALAWAYICSGLLPKNKNGNGRKTKPKSDGEAAKQLKRN